MKRAAIAITFAAAMLGSCGAHADIQITAPAVIGIHTFSVHARDGKDAAGSYGWNNVNPGLYARWDSGLTIGAFRNSLYRESAYIGWTFGDTLALTVGVATGYDRVVNSGGDHTAVRCEQTCRVVQLRSIIAPLVVPSVRIPITAHWSARLSAMKAPRAPAAVHLSIEYRL